MKYLSLLLTSSFSLAAMMYITTEDDDEVKIIKKELLVQSRLVQDIHSEYQNIGTSQHPVPLPIKSSDYFFLKHFIEKPERVNALSTKGLLILAAATDKLEITSLLDKEIDILTNRLIYPPALRQFIADPHLFDGLFPLSIESLLIKKISDLPHIKLHKLIHSAQLEQTFTAPPASHYIISAAINEREEPFILVKESQAAKIYNLISGKAEHVFNGSSIHSGTISPQRTLAALGLRGSIEVHDLIHHSKKNTFLCPNETMCYLGISQDDTTLAAHSNFHTISIWDLTQGIFLRKINVDRVGPLGFRDNKITYFNYNTCKLVDKDSIKSLWSEKSGSFFHLTESLNIFCFTTTSDNKVLISGGNDNKIRIRDMKTHQIIRTISTDNTDLFAIELAPDYSKMITCTQSKIIIWSSPLDTAKLSLSHLLYLYSYIILSPAAHYHPYIIKLRKEVQAFFAQK